MKPSNLTSKVRFRCTLTQDLSSRICKENKQSTKRFQDEVFYFMQMLAPKIHLDLAPHGQMVGQLVRSEAGARILILGGFVAGLALSRAVVGIAHILDVEGFVQSHYNLRGNNLLVWCL